MDALLKHDLATHVIAIDQRIPASENNGWKTTKNAAHE
jgi:hypothetical protein